MVRDDDPLAGRSSIKAVDLEGRVLIVGRASPPELVLAQRMVTSRAHVTTINSADPEGAKLYVRSGRGVVLSPGFVRCEEKGVRWIPFECGIGISCGLALLADDRRPSVEKLVGIAREAYSADPPDVL